MESDKEIMTLKLAEKIAREAHRDQYRKDGSPYIEHVEKVVNQLAENNDAKIAAWLHDVLEDTDMTRNELKQAGISESVVDVVELLTKRREQNYNEYIEQVKTSDLAIKVKKADIIANLSDNPGNKQMVKLAKALIALCR